MLYKLLLIATLAPILYWTLGTATLLLFPSGSNRKWAAPLLGCFIAGTLAELTFIFNLRHDLVTISAFAVAGNFIYRRRPNLETFVLAFKTHYLIYAGTIAVLSLIAFPGLGLWSGDWFYYYTAGESLRTHFLTEQLLERTPIFPGVASPLWLFGSSLAVYQIAAAVVASSVLLALNHAAVVFGKKPLTILSFAYVLLSPFFLLHLAQMWPKFFAGGAIFLSFLEAIRYRRTRSPDAIVWSAIWLGFSISAHHSSVIYAFLMGAILLQRPPRRSEIGRFLLFAAIAAALVLPYELWVIHQYGFGERVAHNPTLTYREAPIFSTAWRGWITSLVGNPVQPLMEVWRSGGHNGHVVNYEGWFGFLAKGYFSLCAWITLLAGSLVGIFLPVPIAMRGRMKKSVRGLFVAEKPAMVAVGLIYVMHSFLLPYVSPWGDAQCGLTGLALMGVTWFLFQLDTLRRTAEALRLTAITGFLPYLMMNLPVLAAYCITSPLSANLVAMLQRQDGDALIMAENRLRSFATATFPWGFLVALGLIFLVRLHNQSAKKKPSSRRQTNRNSSLIRQFVMKRSS